MAKKKQIRRTPAPKGHKPVPSAPVATAPAPPTPRPAAAPKPRVSARFHKKTMTPAGRRGSELVRYLRIHLKRPYGDRGIRAIEKLAREVAHLANLELASRENAN